MVNILIIVKCPRFIFLDEESSAMTDKPSLIVADIPGLVEGAHKNLGLGHDFLKHIEKSRVLCFVLDMSLKAPFEDLAILQSELNQFHPTLFNEKPACIIANKMDIAPKATENLKIFQQQLATSPWKDLPLFPISAKHRLGLDYLPHALLKLVLQD